LVSFFGKAVVSPKSVYRVRLGDENLLGESTFLKHYHRTGMNDMNLDLDILTEEAETELMRKGLTGPADPAFISWMERNQLPPDLIQAVTRMGPKKELWAGVGSIHPEQIIMSRNDEFPNALKSKLLVVGSAGNGDPIAIDLGPGDGAVGYIDHERMWDASEVRDVFVPFGRSIVSVLYHFNLGEDDVLPDDYWEAKERLEKD
jgi:hypothetical protein